MPAEILIPLDEADAPSPSLSPPTPVVLLDAAGQTDARPTAGERLAHLFRHCPAPPLRQIVADHRGVLE